MKLFNFSDMFCDVVHWWLVGEIFSCVTSWKIFWRFALEDHTARSKWEAVNDSVWAMFSVNFNELNKIPGNVKSQFTNNRTFFIQICLVKIEKNVEKVLNVFKLHFQLFVVSQRLQNTQRTGNFFLESRQTFRHIFQNCLNSFHFPTVGFKFRWVLAFVGLYCFFFQVVDDVETLRTVRGSQLPSIKSRDDFLFDCFYALVDSKIFAWRLVSWWTVDVHLIKSNFSFTQFYENIENYIESAKIRLD